MDQTTIASPNPQNPRFNSALEAYQDYLTPPRYPWTKREIELADQASRRRLCVHGEQIEVYAWGVGEPVLLVHGWGGRATQFEAVVLALLDSGFRVVAFDAPGHGHASGDLSSGIAICDSMLAIADGEDEFAAVVAHSIGAVSTTSALRQGLAANRAVFLGACCRVIPTLLEFVSKRHLPSEMEREMLRLFDAQYGREDIDAIAIAPQMTVPLLVLHDREDAEIPFGDAEAYAETWPGSELAAISGVGHRRILRSRAVVDRIVRFLGPLE